MKQCQVCELERRHGALDIEISCDSLMVVRQINFTVEGEEIDSWYHVECTLCGNRPSYADGTAKTFQEAIDIWNAQS